jgi:hypothetical protein
MVVLTSLDFVDDEGNAVLLGDVAQTLEKGRRGVVIATLALDGLDDETGHRAVPSTISNCSCTTTSDCLP